VSLLHGAHRPGHPLHNQLPQKKSGQEQQNQPSKENTRKEAEGCGLSDVERPLCHLAQKIQNVVK